MFLFRVGLVFLLYSILLFSTAMFVYFETSTAKKVSRTLALEEGLWAYFAALIILKFIVGFLGTKLRNFIAVFFCIDCVLSCLVLIGFYFKMENFRRQYY